MTALIAGMMLAAQAITPVGYELGVFKSSSETTPVFATSVAKEGTACKTISVPPAGVTTAQVNPIVIRWTNETDTMECVADLSAFFSTLPPSTQIYVARLRSYGIDPNDPAVKLWNPWSDVSNTFYRPTTFTLLCPSPVQSTTTTVKYSAPTSTGGITPVSTPACSPASGSSFPLGTSSVSCVSKDALGRTSACSFNVAVAPPPPPADTTKPVLRDLAYKRSGSSPNFQVSVRATDNVQVTRVVFYLDGLVHTMLSSSPSTLWQTSIRIDARGQHIISVDAWDAAGNQADTQAIVVTR